MEKFKLLRLIILRLDIMRNWIRSKLERRFRELLARWLRKQELFEKNYYYLFLL